MSQTSTLVIYAWFALAPLLFAFLRPHRAILAGYLFGWLFLPIAVIDTPFVDLDKYAVTSIGVVAGLVLFARDPLARLSFSAWDLPITAWCLCPIATSFENELGLYDGVSAAMHRVLMWGVPYVLARAYFTEWSTVRDMAIAVFIGGLAYVPLCLLEIRLSPQLHRIVYGYHQHSFLQTLRTVGGYRPMVFMHHGLMVGLWMTATTLVGLVLWRTKVLERLGSWRVKWLALALLVTTILCQSFGALILLALGLALFATARRHGNVGVALLVILPCTYCATRISGAWNGAPLVDLTSHFSAERASSLQYRFEQEEVLATRAWQRPLLGWGGFNRAFPPPNVNDFRAAVSDSMWIVVFGMNGIVGLASVVLTCLAPILALARRWRPRRWIEPEVAPAAVLAVVLGLYVMDGMVNMMINPVFTLAAGAITSLALAAPRRAVAEARSDVPDVEGLTTTA